MSEVRISAEPRTEFGKGAARRIRRADKVPAVLYGHGTDPRHISLPGHELMLALQDAPTSCSRSTIDGADELALPKVDPARPDQAATSSTSTWSWSAAARRSPSRSRCTSSATSPPAACSTSSSRRCRVEAEATNIPTERRGLASRASRSAPPIHAKDVALPDRHHAGHRPRAPRRARHPAPTAEQMEADLAEAEAEEPASARPEPLPRRWPPRPTPTPGEAAEGDGRLPTPATTLAATARCRSRGRRPWLVVGLGNPGPVVRRQPAQRRLPGRSTCSPSRVGGRFKAHKGRADVVEGRLGRRDRGGAGQAARPT